MSTKDTKKKSVVGSRVSSKRRSDFNWTENDRGIDLKKLKKWQAEQYKHLLEDEESKQELALLKMKNYVISIRMIVRIQSWARMLPPRHEYLIWRRGKGNIRLTFFRAWSVYWKCEKKYYRAIVRGPFIEWATETQEQKRLQNLALSIFKRAINQSKLTPQAVMAYFNKDTWNGKISEMELNKIRRLILQCLFSAWSSESKRLRIRRFKGSQALTRTLRRTFGALSSKEIMFVSLHLWHRLSAVNLAESRGEPLPVFSFPYIAEWPKVLQSLTLKKVKKIRAAERAKQLIQIRAFKKWRFALQVEATPDDEDLIVQAEAHYIDHLGKRVLHAWFAIVRERGANLRRREKCFRAWARWAPRKRKLKNLKIITREWTRHKTRAMFFRQWAHEIHDIVGRRTYSLRILRQNIFQQNVLYLCYTLLGREGHLMLLDTYRRWKLFWTMRRRWKTTRAKYRIMWHEQKLKRILAVWHQYAHTERQNRKRKRRGEAQLPVIDYSDEQLETYSKDICRAWIVNSCDIYDQARENKLNQGAPSPLEFSTYCTAHFLHSRNSEAVSANKRDTKKFTKVNFLEALEIGDDESADDNSLSRCIVRVDIPGVVNALLNGEQVFPKHLEEVSVCLGDKYVPLVALLLSRCPAYVAKRILKDDTKRELMRCNNPLTAVMLGTTIERWTATDITRRELNTISDDSVLEYAVGTDFQTPVEWRALTLTLLRIRSAALEKECAAVPVTALTEEQEVAIILQRKKLSRLYEIEASLCNLFGIDNQAALERAAYMKSYRAFQVQHKAALQEVKVLQRAKDPWIEELDLGSLLREYALLTGTMADEARRMRGPLMERDDMLLRRGLEKQARLDYLAMRKEFGNPPKRLRKKSKKKKSRSPSPKGELQRQNSDDSMRSDLMRSFSMNEDGEMIFIGAAEHEHLVEVWWPSISCDDEVTTEDKEIFAKNVSDRYKFIANEALSRVVSMLHQTGLPAVPSDLDASTPKITGTQSIGFNFICQIHSNPSLLGLLRHWTFLPRKWWHPNRLASCIAYEISLLDDAAIKCEDRYTSTQKTIKNLTKEVNQLTEYLKDSRKKMLAIGARTSAQSEESKRTREAKVRLIVNAEKTTKMLKEKLASLKELVAICKMKLEEKKYEEVFKLLEVEGSFESLDSAGLDKLWSTAYDMIRKQEDEIPEIMEQIAQSESNIKKHEVDLKNFDRQTKSLNAILVRLAGEKFKDTVDIQQLATSLSDRLSTLKSKETKGKKALQAMINYGDDLNAIVEYLLRTADGVTPEPTGTSAAEPAAPQDSPAVSIKRSASGTPTRKLRKMKSKGGSSARLVRARTGLRTTASMELVQSMKSMQSDDYDDLDESLIVAPVHRPPPSGMIVLDHDENAILAELQGKSIPLRAPDSGRSLNSKVSFGSSFRDTIKGVLEGPSPPAPHTHPQPSTPQPSKTVVPEMEMTPGMSSLGDESVTRSPGRSSILTPKRSPVQRQESLVSFSRQASTASMLTRLASEANIDDAICEFEEEDEEEDEEKIARLRSDLQDEYVRMLEEMEKKDKKKKKLAEQTSRTFSSNFDAALWSIGSTSGAGFLDRQESTGSVAGSAAPSVAAQSTNIYEDDDDESVLLRQMSRTARMYLAATRASKLQKLNKDWPDAAGLVADSYDLYDIASGEGIRFEESKQLAEREPGEDVNINAPVENAEMMWKPSSPVALTVSMSTDGVDRGEIATRLSTANSRPNSKESVRRKAVAKVVVLDPFAAAGSASLENLKFNAVSSGGKVLRSLPTMMQQLDEYRVEDTHLIPDEDDPFPPEPEPPAAPLSAAAMAIGTPPQKPQPAPEAPMTLQEKDEALMNKAEKYKFWSGGRDLGDGPHFSRDEISTAGSTQPGSGKIRGASIDTLPSTASSDKQPPSSPIDARNESKLQVTINDSETVSFTSNQPHRGSPLKSADSRRSNGSQQSRGSHRKPSAGSAASETHHSASRSRGSDASQRISSPIRFSPEASPARGSSSGSHRSPLLPLEQRAVSPLIAAKPPSRVPSPELRESLPREEPSNRHGVTYSEPLETSQQFIGEASQAPSQTVSDVLLISLGSVCGVAPHQPKPSKEGYLTALKHHEEITQSAQRAVWQDGRWQLVPSVRTEITREASPPKKAKEKSMNVLTVTGKTPGLPAPIHPSQDATHYRAQAEMDSINDSARSSAEEQYYEPPPMSPGWKIPGNAGSSKRPITPPPSLESIVKTKIIEMNNLPRAQEPEEITDTFREDYEEDESSSPSHKAYRNIHDVFEADTTHNKYHHVNVAAAMRSSPLKPQPSKADTEKKLRATRQKLRETHKNTAKLQQTQHLVASKSLDNVVSVKLLMESSESPENIEMGKTLNRFSKTKRNSSHKHRFDSSCRSVNRFEVERSQSAVQLSKPQDVGLITQSLSSKDQNMRRDVKSAVFPPLRPVAATPQYSRAHSETDSEEAATLEYAYASVMGAADTYLTHMEDPYAGFPAQSPHSTYTEGTDDSAPQSLSLLISSLEQTRKRSNSIGNGSHSSVSVDRDRFIQSALSSSLRAPTPPVIHISSNALAMMPPESPEEPAALLTPITGVTVTTSTRSQSSIQDDINDDEEEIENELRHMLMQAKQTPPKSKKVKSVQQQSLHKGSTKEKQHKPPRKSYSVTLPHLAPSVSTPALKSRSSKVPTSSTGTKSAVELARSFNFNLTNPAPSRDGSSTKYNIRLPQDSDDNASIGSDGSLNSLSVF